MQRIGICAIALVITAVLPASALAGEPLTAAAAFDQLTTLAGEWTGEAAGKGNEEAEAATGHAVHHVFEVSAASTVVMETMNPGSDHEMVNMYHVDGDDLVMTHYCAGGNQPTMRVKLDESSPGHLVFEFTGGTNLDPSTDQHIHDAELTWNADGTLKSAWRAFGGGEHVGDMVFTLSRSE